MDLQNISVLYVNEIAKRNPNTAVKKNDLWESLVRDRVNVNNISLVARDR